MSGSPNMAPGSSHRSPASLGTMIKSTIERGNPYMAPRLYNVEITILEIIRGTEALERINAQGVLNDPPEPGNEYILALIKFGYFHRGRGLDDTYKLTDGQFAAASEDGETEYKTPSVLQQPQPQLIDWLFHPGESREGWVFLQIPKENKQPLLIFKRERVDGVYGIWGHLWFQLY
ncbi:hypothetical protein ACFLZG_07170 [Thermodesulfobacteriota bacterium]